MQDFEEHTLQKIQDEHDNEDVSENDGLEVDIDYSKLPDDDKLG